MATYASSACTSLSSYIDIPVHHLKSTLDLIDTPPASSYPKGDSSDDGTWASTDFSRVSDLETLLRFLEVSNYCFGYYDFDDGDNDPLRSASTSRST